MNNNFNEPKDEKEQKDTKTQSLISSRKKVLSHQPAIVPTQPLKPEEIENSTPQSLNQETEKEKAQVTIDDPIASVRVRNSTRAKLNTLINLGRADSVDALINILADEYVDSNLPKEERKTFEIMYQAIKNRKRK